jgi:hypothetical protein
MAFNTIKPISEFYPDFSNWYWDKVVPGVLIGSDKIIMAEKHGELVGIALIKIGEEKKLRALRINEKFQSSGAGLYLIDEALRLLGTDKPVATVAEEMIHDYSRIFVERYGFNLSRVHKGMYRKGKLEYSFNEKIDLKNKSICF